MDTKNLLRKSGPYILAIVLFLVISVIYFSPVWKERGCKVLMELNLKACRKKLSITAMQPERSALVEQYGSPECLPI